MLADKNQLLHAVAILLVPVSTQSWIFFHELLQLCFGHRCIPLTCITDTYLLTCLLKYVAGFLFIAEVTDALSTDNSLRPFARNKLIKEP